MAQICPVCKGDDIANGLDRARCLSCDTVLTYEDNLILKPATSRLENNPTLNAYDGPLEPDVKGGPGAAVASQGGVTEDALQQSGAVPQHGLSIPAADNTSVPSDVGVNYDQRPDPLHPVLLKAKTVEDERNSARDFDVKNAKKADGVDGDAAERMQEAQAATAGPARQPISVEHAVELKGDGDPAPDNTPVEKTGGGAHGTSVEQLEARGIEPPSPDNVERISDALNMTDSDTSNDPGASSDPRPLSERDSNASTDGSDPKGTDKSDRPRAAKRAPAKVSR
jgi:hypothetical protein